MAGVDTLKTLCEIAKLAIDGGVALDDARRRRAAERRQDADHRAAEQGSAEAARERRIAELEDELARLRGGG